MRDRQRLAYVTLCANPEFLPGVRCLARSLARTGTPYPLVCMVPVSLLPLARRALSGERVETRSVAPLPLSPDFERRHSNEVIEVAKPMTRGSKPAFHSKLLNFLKLRAWELTEFDKVVFLDADAVVIRPIERLFDYPAVSAAPNLYAQLQDFHRINSGVLVLEPSREQFKKMVAVLDAPGAFWPRTDQTFLETYFQAGPHSPMGLPYFFNTLQYLWFNQPDLWHWPAIHVIHYQFEKPWDESSFQGSEKSRIRRRLLAPLVDLWHTLDSRGQFSPERMIHSHEYLVGLSRDLSDLKAMDSVTATDLSVTLRGRSARREERPWQQILQ